MIKLRPPFVGHTVTKWIMFKFLPQSCSLKALPGNSDSSSSVRWLHLEFRLIFHRCFQNTQGTQYFCYQILPCSEYEIHFQNASGIHVCFQNAIGTQYPTLSSSEMHLRNTLGIHWKSKKISKKWPWLLQWILYFFVTQAMPAWACCGSCSAGFPVRLMPPHLEEHDSPSVMGSISGYSERMWKDVKGCERMWKDVKGCETTSGPQEMWC